MHGKDTLHAIAVELSQVPLQYNFALVADKKISLTIQPSTISQEQCFSKMIQLIGQLEIYSGLYRFTLMEIKIGAKLCPHRTIFPQSF